MSEVRKFIESGILEMYLMGDASPEENVLVELMGNKHPEVKEELLSIEVALEEYALSQATTVDPVIKPFLMATVEYMERMSKGEQLSFPPKLHTNSLISDFEEWLNRPDFVLTEPLDEIDARIIAATPQMTTAIVWIKNGSPPEIHKSEYETFLIIEGTCNIVVDGQDNHLKSGDVFTIPLYLSHTVVVTSEIPCKLILERLAA